MILIVLTRDQILTYLDKLNIIVKQHSERLSGIKLVAFDVDGVLTSGQLTYEANGETTKVFHVRDGVGLKLLQDFGFEVAIVTAKDSPMVRTRMSEMGIRHYYPGSKDKLAVLTQMSQQLALPLSACSFVGDDVVDLPAMSASGLSFCPQDAYPLVQSQADVVLDVNGGSGVARVVADILLLGQGKYEKAYELASTSLFERRR